MNKFILASHNPNKIKEVKAILEPLGIDIVGIKEIMPNLKDIEETGTTFEENAKIKADTICKLINQPVIADDSGFMVKALNGAPGIYSARFMGEQTSYDIKNQAIIDAVSGKERQAQFVSVVALARPNQETLTFKGIIEGEVHDCIEGESGFGYDPIFYVPSLKKPFAMMNDEEKNLISHRGQSLKHLYDYLKREKEIN